MSNPYAWRLPIINGVPPERAACLKLQEVAFKALETEKGGVKVYSTAWIQSLGVKAVLPPREEIKDVKTAIGAEQARTDML